MPTNSKAAKKLRARVSWTALAGGAALGAIAAWFAFAPTAKEAHAIADYDRVRDVGARHEACLKGLADTDDPATLREAKETISHVRTRAGECFRGDW